jgi:hypothetical protein
LFRIHILAKSQGYCKIMAYDFRTRYFIPDHKKAVATEYYIEEFRRYISDKKKRILEQKSLMKKLAEQDDELEEMFISEIEKELDKDKDK